jgi:hypothetical protein
MRKLLRGMKLGLINNLQQSPSWLQILLGDIQQFKHMKRRSFSTLKCLVFCYSFFLPNHDLASRPVRNIFLLFNRYNVKKECFEFDITKKILVINQQVLTNTYIQELSIFSLYYPPPSGFSKLQHYDVV